MSETAASSSRASRRLVLIACLLAMFMAAVEATIVATAMPTIIADLGGFQLYSWVFSVYLLTQAISIPIYGKLADIYGRKPAFIVGSLLFLGASTAAGFSGSMIQLILFRAIQGLGAGAIVPVATTIIGDLYTAEERGRLQGHISAVWGGAAIVGPILGAFFVEHANWSLVFWVNLPAGIVAIWIMLRHLDEGARRMSHSIDYPGAALMTLGTAALMLALIQGASLPSGVLGALAAIFLLCLAGFLHIERRATEPMMPLEIWRNRAILFGNIAQFTSGIVMISVVAVVPSYVQAVMGRSAAAAGLVLTAMLIGWPLASTFGGRLMVWTSFRVTALAGALSLLLGSAVLSLLLSAHGLAWISVGSFFIGLGMGFCSATFVIAAQSSVGWQRRGIATSVNIFMRYLGQSVGAACFGAILNFALAASDPGAADLVNRLMDPVSRAQLDPARLTPLANVISGALHQVFLIATLMAAATLLAALAFPARLNPRTVTAE